MNQLTNQPINPNDVHPFLSHDFPMNSRRFELFLLLTRPQVALGSFGERIKDNGVQRHHPSRARAVKLTQW